MRETNRLYYGRAFGLSFDFPKEGIIMDVINAFPGYEYIDGKNIYRGDDLGKGG